MLKSNGIRKSLGAPKLPLSSKAEFEMPVYKKSCIDCTICIFRVYTKSKKPIVPLRPLLDENRTFNGLMITTKTNNNEDLLLSTYDKLSKPTRAFFDLIPFVLAV
jgi:hypothetical protein